MKRCSKCGEMKPLDQFYKHKLHKDGRATQCKTCRAAAGRSFYAAHSEQVRNATHAYRAAHLEKVRAWERAWRAAHLEEARSCASAWRKANPEKKRESNRRWEAAHPEKKRQYGITYRVRHQDAVSARWHAYNATHRLQKKERDCAYHKAHPDVARKANRKYAANHPENMRMQAKNRRAKMRGAVGSHSVAEWRALTEKYDHTCLRCGRREPDIKLTADHVVPLALGGSNDIGNIQPLCGSCNSIKQAKHIDYRPGSFAKRAFIQEPLFHE